MAGAWSAGNIIANINVNIKDYVKNLTIIKKETKKTVSIITKTFKLIGVAIKGSIKYLGKFIKTLTSVPALMAAFAAFKFIDLVKQAENLDYAFRNLQSSIGLVSGDTLDAMRKGMRGAVADIDLMRAANNAVLLGVGKSAEDFALLAEAGRRLGKAVGRDAVVGFNDLTVGIGRLSWRLLDNLGIILKLGTANAEYAKSHGILNRKLTDSEKAIAFYEGALSRIKAKLESLGPDVLSMSEQFGQLSAAIKNSTIALGTGFVKPLAEIADRFASYINKYKQQIESFGSFVGGVAKALIVSVLDAMEKSKEPLTMKIISMVEYFGSIISTAVVGIVGIALKAGWRKIEDLWPQLKKKFSNLLLDVDKDVDSFTLNPVAWGKRLALIANKAMVDAAISQAKWKLKQKHHFALREEDRPEKERRLRSLEYQSDMLFHELFPSANETKEKRETVESEMEALVANLSAIIKKGGKELEGQLGIEGLGDEISAIWKTSVSEFESAWGAKGDSPAKHILEDFGKYFSANNNVFDKIADPKKRKEMEELNKTIQDQVLGLASLEYKYQKIGKDSFEFGPLKAVMQDVAADIAKNMKALNDGLKAGIIEVPEDVFRKLFDEMSNGADKATEALDALNLELNGLSDFQIKIEAVKKKVSAIQMEGYSDKQKSDIRKFSNEWINLLGKIEAKSKELAQVKLFEKTSASFDQLSQSSNVDLLGVDKTDAENKILKLRTSVYDSFSKGEIDTSQLEKLNFELDKLAEKLLAAEVAAESFKAKEEANKGVETLYENIKDDIVELNLEKKKLLDSDFDVTIGKWETALVKLAEAAGLSEKEIAKILVLINEAKSKAKENKKLEEYKDAVKSTSDSIFLGIVDGFKRGESVAKTFANIFASLWQKAMNSAVENIGEWLATKIGAIMGKAPGMAALGGLAVGLVALGGAIYQNLNSKGSANVEDFSDAVNSSEQVRGIVAGPTNVAIATIADSLKTALTTTEMFLQRIAFAVEGGNGPGMNSMVQDNTTYNLTTTTLS